LAGTSVRLADQYGVPSLVLFSHLIASEGFELPVWPRSGAIRALPQSSHALIAGVSTAASLRKSTSSGRWPRATSMRSYSPMSSRSGREAWGWHTGPVSGSMLIRTPGQSLMGVARIE